MKILHTADWHLGAKTDRRNRIEEQKLVMKEIIELAEKEKVDLVLIAGDIFDQSVPTSEAEELFYDTLEKLSSNNNRVVVALAGNHDDPKRLSANKHFAKKHNIVLVGDLQPICELNVNENAKIIDIGEGFIRAEFKNNHGIEKVAVGILPYPIEYRLNKKSEAETYTEKVAEWARICAKGFKKDCFNILASHLMVSGAFYEEDGYIRDLKVGDAMVIPKTVLPRADYYALGHLHDHQKIKDVMVYSGAPLRYSYTQEKAGVCLLTIHNNSIREFKFVSLKSASRMEKVCVYGRECIDDRLKNFGADDIIELTIVQDKPLTSKDILEIKEKYPCVLNVKLQLTNIQSDDKVYIQNRDKMSASDLFTNFYKQKRGVLPTNKVLERFIQLMEDKQSETN